MNERIDEVIGNLLFATDLLRDEITYAPTTSQEARAAGYLEDIHFTLQQIAEDEWDS